MYRPGRQKIREIWMEIYKNMHEPNQREDELQRIENLKLKRETVAEDVDNN